MDGTMVTENETDTFRAGKGLLTRKEITSILEFSISGRVVELDLFLSEIAERHGTTKGVLLMHARDDEGRNAVHHAAMSQSIESLEYLLRPQLFPNQPALRIALFHAWAAKRENPAMYAIRHHCSPDFLDRIITVGTPSILRIPTADGLWPLHLAAIEDADELVIHLVTNHNLDPTQPFTPPAPAADQAPDSETTTEHGPTARSGPVKGDTPLHLAARYGCDSAFEALHARLGGDISTAFNSEGDAAIDVAARVGAADIFAYLDQKPATPDLEKYIVYSREGGEQEQEESDSMLEAMDGVVVDYIKTEEELIGWYGGKEYVPAVVWDGWMAKDKKGCGWFW